MSETSEEKMRLAVKEPIIAIRQEFNRLTELWAMDALDDAEYMDKLRQFVWFDEAGRQWVISPENGNWYTLTEDGPVLGEPAEFLYRPAEERPGQNAGNVSEARGAPPPALVCRACGATLNIGDAFCSNCGKPAEH
jgi:hypothetical protein